MEAILSGIGKRFQDKWIFNGLNLKVQPGRHHVITGKNGSGKSTLLMIIAGYLAQSRGDIQWKMNGHLLPPEKVFEQVAVASPYLELVEEFSLEESIAFQSKFKPFRDQKSQQEILALSGLKDSATKPLKNFSSGMKQRAKLVMAIMSQSPLLLLDEPCANLDADAIKWYQHMMDTWCQNRTLVVCSNHNVHEYHTATENFNLG
jgi:ABC-type multidrug transport system ATPase subunit